MSITGILSILIYILLTEKTVEYYNESKSLFWIGVAIYMCIFAAWSIYNGSMADIFTEGISITGSLLALGFYIVVGWAHNMWQDTLTLESLRAIGGWAADCGEHALPVFETRAASDTRPRAAIEGIREFMAGGKRVARLRTLASQAHAAAREVGDPAAAAAARAAGSAAASAYTHPLRDVHQTKHIVGPRRPMPHWRLSSTSVATQVSANWPRAIGFGRKRSSLSIISGQVYALESASLRQPKPADGAQLP